MVVEQELLPFWVWLLGNWWQGGPVLGAGLRFLITAAVLAVIAIFVGFLIALVRHGPLKAGDLTYRVVANGLSELSRTSWRRVWTLARHAFKESMRRRVWVAVVVFFLVLLFASWFLQTGYREPGKLFFSFALTTTTYLVLFIALLVSAFSLPQEFKSKTIYTLMTKPVRAGDVVIGRILGFALVGTVILTAMAAANAVFVERMLHHIHEVEVTGLEDVLDADGKVVGKKGLTSPSQSHRHEVDLDANGNGVALFANGHEHTVTAVERGGTTVYQVSGPVGTMRARVPDYGKLRFLDRHGTPVAKGISVGSEWTYRSFIDGGSSAAAIWTFDNVNPSKLQRAADGSQVLPLELNVRVFRTFKGIIGQGIQGSVQLRNPDTGLQSSLWTFTAKDAAAGVATKEGGRKANEDLQVPSINSFAWPRKLDDKDRNSIDLLDDLVTQDGRVEVVVQCLEKEQYYGFAQPDCYVRLADGSPRWNFCKAQISIWMQMLLVIAIAVAASTLVNGPVAMLFTGAFIILGFYREFFVSVATGEQTGGGPVESFVRLITQKNLSTGLDKGTAVDLMHAVDWVLKGIMMSLTYVLPDFKSYSTVGYVAYGFDIPINKIFQDLTVGLAYVAGVCVLGYFLLRTREVAK
ncbi:MAG: ABC transporter permease [Pirellulales bacterium]